MLEQIEKLKLLDMLTGESALDGEYRDRFSHALVFKLSGSSEYLFAGRTLHLGLEQCILLPKGSSYRVRRTSPERSRYLVMNFEGEIPGVQPRVWSMEGFAEQGLIRDSLADLWLLGGAAERYRCMAVFYQTLAFLTGLEQADYAYTRKTGAIRTAVDCLHANLFDPSLRISDLHKLCGLSDTYFRRIFRASFGVNPQEYVTNKRLAQAAAVIGSGEFRSIGDVAQSVGYADALYFSRAFAKRYGVCPSDYVHTLQGSRG